MPWGASDWVEEQFITAIDRIFGAIADFLYILMAEFLGLLEYFILRTPYPSCSEEWEGEVSGCNTSADHGAAIIFDTPPDGSAWFELYQIFEATQPYGYLMLVLAAVMGSFINVFYGIMPSMMRYSPKKLRQRIVLGFILITFWWYIAVFMLAFADALTQALANAGAADTEASGLELGYAILMEFIEDATDGASYDSIIQLGVTIVIVAVFFIKKIFLLILLLIWILRIFVIYLGIPLMPLFIGMWAFHLPGFSALNKIGEKALNWFSVLVFLSVPGGIFIGFSATVLEVVLEIVTSQDDGAGVDDSNISRDEDGNVDLSDDGGYEYDDPTESVVINSQDSGSSSGLHAESITGNNEAEIVADQIVSSTAAADAGFGGIVLGLALGIGIAAAMPFIAAMGPFIVVALADGDAKTLAMGAANPGAAIMNTAAGGRGKAGFAAGMLGETKKKAVGGEAKFGDNPTLDKEAAAKSIDDKDIEEWSDMSRKQKYKAKKNQQGLLGAASFSSRIASQEVRENYDEARDRVKAGAPGAYVKARAVAGNKDYRSGVYNEMKTDVGSSLRAGSRNAINRLPLQGTDQNLLQTKAEDMTQRINNVKAGHESLKDESRKLDYKDAADDVDASVSLSEREKAIYEEFGDVESRQEMMDIATNEEEKYNEIKAEIEEIRNDRTAVLTDDKLEEKREQRERMRLAKKASGGPANETSELERVQQQVETQERAEEMGMVNEDIALGEGDKPGRLKVIREAERGNLTEDELREVLQDSRSRQTDLSAQIESVQESDQNGIATKLDTNSLQKEKQQMENIEEVVEGVLEGAGTVEDQIEDAADNFEDALKSVEIDTSDINLNASDDIEDLSESLQTMEEEFRGGMEKFFEQAEHVSGNEDMEELGEELADVRKAIENTSGAKEEELKEIKNELETGIQMQQQESDIQEARETRQVLEEQQDTLEQMMRDNRDASRSDRATGGTSKSGFENRQTRFEQNRINNQQKVEEAKTREMIGLAFENANSGDGLNIDTEDAEALQQKIDESISRENQTGEERMSEEQLVWN